MAPALRQLASDDGWQWVLPVCQEEQVVGLLAVGHLPPPGAGKQETMRVLRALIPLAWNHLAARRRLGVSLRTDKATGVLTRADFFEVAGAALRESYAQNEPAVSAVLSIEGLRLLDDRGMWTQRDELVEELGRLLTQRVRSDDVVGRFSDDRFVLLLRRIDTALARLIIAKIVTAAQAELARFEPVGALRVRSGIAGSGLREPDLDALLVSAFRAVEAARLGGCVVASDVGGPVASLPTEQAEEAS